MLKKQITYTDYNGVTRTEDFYFNISQAELSEMELSVEGGFSTFIKYILEAQSTPELIKTFKDLIMKAYGEKTTDGLRFRKTDEKGNPLCVAFSETEAYSVLFMELATDDVAAAEFVNGITPANIDKAEIKAATEASNNISLANSLASNTDTSVSNEIVNTNSLDNN